MELRMIRSKRPSRWLLLGFALSPLSAALAAELCPVDPWQCERSEQGWHCSGQPKSLQNAAVDNAARVQASTQLNGDRLDGTDGEKMLLQGNASAVRADQNLRADSIEYDIAKDSALAQGNVRYEDGQHAFYATEARADLGKDTTELADVRYALKARRGQGRAEKVVTAGGQQTTLEDVTYTACPGDDPSWQIEASKLSIDNEAGQATARDFKVRIGGIPVLYSPYASFPIDDRRKSGLLAPKIGYGSDGFDFALPYYWNLAPNYDATLIPRLISDRGIQAGGEFRYLYSGGSGQIDGEWLPNDDLLHRDRSRWRVRQAGTVLPGVRLDADINQVSDDRYFADLGDSLNTSSTSVQASIAQLSGGGRNWHWSVLADKYELILPDTAEAYQANPYQRLPRAALQFEDRRGPWRYGVNTEWVDFSRDSFCVDNGAGGCLQTQSAEGRRFDIAPYLGYELNPSWGHLRARGTVRHTSYDLDRHLSANAACRIDGSCPDSIDRTTPIVSLDGGLQFERPNAFGVETLRQTLEPRLYYLYVPQRDQNDIPVFDTAPFDFSFAQLFRENRYTGADRQADANQLTLALTSRLLDDELGDERAAFSLGQVYYFDAPTVYLPDELARGIVDGRQRSAYVAEIRARLSGTWSLTGGLRYDPETDRTDFGAVRLQKRFGEQGLLNLGYRYRPGQLEQSDISALVPINDHWRAVFRWNYSLREQTTLEAVAGFEYINCCYSVRLLSRNYLRGIGTERRNAIFLEFELTGLGSLGRDTGDFLRRAILGYQPFGGISE
jgi:LPS-assembly protein